MKGKGGPIVGGAVALLLLSGGYFVLTPPERKYATPEQVQAMIDPVLLKPIQNDPAAQERFWDLGQAIAPIESRMNMGAKSVADYEENNRQWKLAEPIFEEAEKVFRIGELEEPASGYANPSETRRIDWTTFRYVALAAEYGSEAAAKLGHIDEAISRLRDGVSFMEHTTRHPRTFLLAMMRPMIRDMMSEAALSIARSKGVTAAQVKRLLAVLPKPETQDKITCEALRGEFQILILPALPNPTKQPYTPFTEGPMAMASYDAFETTREANRFWSASVEALRMPYAKRNAAVLGSYNTAMSSLVPLDSPGNPFVDFFGGLKVRGKPNYIGKALLNAFTPSTENVLGTSVKSRTELELVRAVAGCVAYKAQAGAYPFSLRELVAKGWLDDLPRDLWSGEPLQYDPAHKKIWAVGMDCRDDRGSINEEMSLKEPDFGLRLP